MELIKVEALKSRIKTKEMTMNSTGTDIHLSREEAFLILRMLEKEISIRKLTEGGKE